MKKVLLVIVTVGILFGAAHIFSDEAWSTGKLAQAVASGIIIGCVYFRYGLVPAILIHWATNYFIFSYGLIVADINQISTKKLNYDSSVCFFEYAKFNTKTATEIIPVTIIISSIAFSRECENASPIEI